MSTAFVFPGQGSQQVGMMDGFGDHPVVRTTFAEASEVLGEDLWQLVHEGPPEALNLTRNTQPVMLAAGVAAWRAWQQSGGAAPSYMAGHSLGEYTALVVAGALAFRDAVPLVRFRAEAMQEAVPAGSGAMAGKGEPSPVASESAPATRCESESSASQAVGGLTGRFGREIEQPEDLNGSAVILRVWTRRPREKSLRLNRDRHV